jgi:hypothetical protein
MFGLFLHLQRKQNIMILLALKKIPTTGPNSKNHFKELAAAFKKLSKTQKLFRTLPVILQLVPQTRKGRRAYKGTEDQRLII